MTITRKSCVLGRITLLLLLVFSLTVSLRAQQESSSQSNANATSSKQQTNTEDSGTTAQDAAPPPQPVFLSSAAPQIQQVGSAGNLLENISPLRWGPVYVSSAQYSQVFDRGPSFTGSGSFQNAASLFSSTVVFDKSFQSSRIALQYVPRIVVLNGQVLNDFANQNASLDMVFALSPRWTLSVGDHVTYFQSNNAFQDSYLDANAVTGTTLQRTFLQGPISWLSNSVGLSLGYMLGPRTRISFAPNFVYSSTSSSTVAVGNQTTKEIVGRFSISHDLSPRSTFNAFYTADDNLYQGIFSDTLYQSFGIGYSRQFGVGWTLGSTVGAGTANFASGRDWTLTGSFSLVKAFRRSSVGLAASRGHSLAGYISNNYTDRVDATYRTMLWRRWSASAGFGYERDISGLPTSSASGPQTDGIWGKYANGDISYVIRPTVSLFADYVKVWQRGDQVQVLTGNRDFIEFGIRWNPAPAQR